MSRPPGAAPARPRRGLPGLLAARTGAGNPRTAAAAVRAVLADGAFHPWWEISARAAPLIVPETAIDTYCSQYHRGKGRPPEPEDP
ncbi:MAG TPA: hypothetical protein VKG45_06425, partial [Actinomycetes bacterium]|nr:hypothetical protein [Actinomycetes bacterium]